MKETVLDILIDLFENDFDVDERSAEPDRATLESELKRAGFCEREVGRALEWLEHLRPDGERAGAVPQPQSIRVFDSGEQARLDSECRGFILQLGTAGILSPAQRELVIDRLLALDARQIELDQVKWVALMVLSTQPGQQAALMRMEDLVFDNRLEAVH